MSGGMELRQLATELGAKVVLPSEQTPSLDPGTVTGVASPATATERSLLFAEDQASFEAAFRSRARIVLTTAALFEALPQAVATAEENSPDRVFLLVAQPRLAFARAAKLLAIHTATLGGVHSTAVIAASARLGEHVTVGPQAVIEADAHVGSGSIVGAGAVVGEGVILGPGCRIYPRVVLYPGVQLGARVVVHAGAVLGADGFGYVRDRETGAYTQFPQQGVLIVEDDVEIGANTTVDRGALEETRIARGTKLDNLVHVGHNVRVGANVVIAAQTGISGSSTIGDGAVIAGQVGIADHVEIGPGVIVGAQGGVPSNKKLRGPGVVFWGTPARPITQYLKELAAMARLARRAGKS